MLLLNTTCLGPFSDIFVEVLPAVAQDLMDVIGKGRPEAIRQAEWEELAWIPAEEVAARVEDIVAEIAFDEPPETREALRSALGQLPVAARSWVDVCDVLSLDAESRESVRGLVREAMDGLEVRSVEDHALSVNLRERTDLAINCGRPKALNVRKCAGDSSFGSASPTAIWPTTRRRAGPWLNNASRAPTRASSWSPSERGTSPGSPRSSRSPGRPR